jgi:AcrR family transcriptional regulator
MPLPRSGPLRSEAARLAILDATAAILVERGYDGLTMEGIAARAGVGKQTIYRWWNSKSAVVAESLLEGRLMLERLSLPDTGDIRDDLSTWLRSIAGVLGDELGDNVFRSLVAAATDNADIGRRLRDSLSGSESVSGRLASAIGSVPHLPPGAPVDEIAETLIGAVVLRALSRSPLDETAIRDILTAVLGPEE